VNGSGIFLSSSKKTYYFFSPFYLSRPQLRLEKLNGVARCTVGYSGGKEADPTYQSIKDYTEALFVEFDPSVVSYEDLVVSWTQMHKPNYKRNCQYRSAVWYLGEEQKDTSSEEVVEGWQASAGELLFTSVEPATSFYKGEEYHQYFLTKQGRGNTRWAC
jgi:methionine-S-sulfoxide reductase